MHFQEWREGGNDENKIYQSSLSFMDSCLRRNDERVGFIRRNDVGVGFIRWNDVGIMSDVGMMWRYRYSFLSHFAGAIPYGSFVTLVKYL